MSKIAFIFPGQGAQVCGMGQDFYEQTETGKKIFDMASGLLGFSMPELCFTPNDRLDITEYTQAAMVTASIAMMEVLKERTGVKPDVAAGLSLGEYPAMVAAGVMSAEDAIKTVRQRGILMQEAVPVGIGSMAAVLAMDAEKIEEVIAPIEGVQIANYNCPGQIVISGKKEAVEAASEKLKEAGAKRVLPLNVSGPFHSSMLVEAGEKLGFLPGDLQSKIDPYLRPLYDALYQIMGAESYLHNSEKGLIEVAPLAYMRGRTLDNAFIILDEAQNTTPAQMKMFLTRIGFGSKVIVTGDQSQKDLPAGAVSGLDVALRVLKKIDDIGVCYLTSTDVVRHPLVQKIVQAYDDYELRNKKSAEREPKREGLRAVRGRRVRHDSQH